MTLVENLQAWQEAVQFYNEGDFQRSLEKFQIMKDNSAKITFNIGRVFMSLCEVQMSLEAFQLVIRKDTHLVVGHFMLGVANLMCAKHQDAMINFDEALRNLRGSKCIDYKQLGMRYKLYKCEVLLNRAVCLSSLGYLESATEDLLAALQCKVEPRHNIIDISLENLQRGKSIEFIVMDAIFQPPKSKTANLEKRDYLGKSQIVVDAYEVMVPPGHLRDPPSSVASESVVRGETYRVLYDFNAQNSSEVSVRAGDVITVTKKADDGWFTMIAQDEKKTGLVPGTFLEKVKEEKPKQNEQRVLSGRQSLLADLRKKESRQSLRRVQPPSNKPHAVPRHLDKPVKLDDTSIPIRPPKPPNKRPVTIARTNGNTSPKLPHATYARHSSAQGEKISKISRQTSLENLLGNSPLGSPVSGTKSPGGSPSWGKKFSDRPPQDASDDSDEDGYIDIEGELVDPYAINDIIPPGERSPKPGWKAPERPVPPAKMGVTLKPRLRVDPPVIMPRSNTVPNSNLVIHNAVPVIPTTKPVKKPPKLPTSPKRQKKNKEKAKNVIVEFIVSTSLELTSSTSQEDIQTSARAAIAGNNVSNLWCEKDGKKIRLNDSKAPNILDLVKDGKLQLWCTP